MRHSGPPWNRPILHRSVCCNLTAFFILFPTGVSLSPPVHETHQRGFQWLCRIYALWTLLVFNPCCRCHVLTVTCDSQLRPLRQNGHNKLFGLWPRPIRCTWVTRRHPRSRHTWRGQAARYRRLFVFHVGAQIRTKILSEAWQAFPFPISLTSTLQYFCFSPLFLVQIELCHCVAASTMMCFDSLQDNMLTCFFQWGLKGRECLHKWPKHKLGIVKNIEKSLHFYIFSCDCFYEESTQTLWELK